jgi:hypothetical protein
MTTMSADNELLGDQPSDPSVRYIL